MTRRPRSLRNTLTAVGVTAAVLALLVAAMVIVLTTLLHRATVAIEQAIESVKLAEDSGVRLILHGQASQPIVRRELGGHLRLKLIEARQLVRGEREAAVLDEAEARVLAYLDAAEAERPAAQVTTLHTAAYGALEELANVNLTSVRAEAQRSRQLDELANVAGIVFVVVVLVLVGIFIYWVRGAAFRSLFDLSHDMARFGRGDRAVRANVAGPHELQEMASRFNEMAALIVTQRDDQRAFLAGVAHDLRNPLAALMASVHAARREATLPPDHRARRTLDRVSRQLVRLDRMITDFLDAARIEAGQLELRFEVRDLRDVLRTVVELFEDASPRHELVLTVPPDPVEARFDPLRIEQVATNLVGNAIKYSPGGGVVEIRLERGGGEVYLAVSDDGIGISPEAQRRLFEPFHRGLSNTEIPGVGLGLFVVRRIVEAHGWRIDVESAPGAGSTFRVTIPS
jgi:two-component system, OmpR family, sensor histidine kinase MtrB